MDKINTICYGRRWKIRRRRRRKKLQLDAVDLTSTNSLSVVSQGKLYGTNFTWSYLHSFILIFFSSLSFHSRTRWRYKFDFRDKNSTNWGLARQVSRSVVTVSIAYLYSSPSSLPTKTTIPCQIIWFTLHI